MELRLPVSVHMCRQAAEIPAHFLRRYHTVSHVGQLTVLRCFGEVFPRNVSIALGMCFSERKAKVKASKEQAAPQRCSPLTRE